MGFSGDFIPPWPSVLPVPSHSEAFIWGWLLSSMPRLRERDPDRQGCEPQDLGKHPEPKTTSWANPIPRRQYSDTPKPKSPSKRAFPCEIRVCLKGSRQALGLFFRLLGFHRRGETVKRSNAWLGAHSISRLVADGRKIWLQPELLPLGRRSYRFR